MSDQREAELTHLGLARVELLTEPQIEQLMRMYAGEWWTSTRTFDDVSVMLDRTPLVIGLVEHDTETLVAFARVVTDGVYYGTLLDVIVDTSRRGRGYGDALMRSVLDHPTLNRLRSLGLTCRDDKIAFYERWGFEVRWPLPIVEGMGAGAEMMRRHPLVNPGATLTP